MSRRLTVLLIAAMVLSISLAPAMSLQTSVENSGNTIYVHKKTVTDLISIETPPESADTYEVVEDSQDPNTVHIVNENDPEGHTINSMGEVDFTINLPQNMKIIFCIKGTKILSTFDMELRYRPPGGSDKVCTGMLTSNIGKQYYYPSGNSIKKVNGQNYEPKMFMSEVPVAFRFSGVDLGITPLDVSIITG